MYLPLYPERAIQAAQQSLLWTDIGLWSMQYIGPPYIYSFNEVGTGCGLISKKAAKSINGAVYWMGASQFFTLSSGGVQPVPCPVWDVIFQDLDTSNLDKIRVAVNTRFNEIAWYYPTVSSGGEVNAYVKYNIYLSAWDFGILGRTAWVDQSVLGAPIGADPNDLYIYQHEVLQSTGQTLTNAGGATGQTPMNSTFTTGYFAMNEGDLLTFVDQVWPDMRWGFYGGSQSATVNITFNVTQYPGDATSSPGTNTSNSYGPYAVTQATEYVTPRFRSRLVSITVSSNDANSFWRIGNIRYRYQQDGKY